MKILVISNFYPPYSFGGYEVLCQMIIKFLESKGYGVQVLTSNYGVKESCSEDTIHRLLSYRFKAPESPVSLKETIKRDIGDNLSLKRIISDFNPDLLYVFDMAGLSKSLLLTMQELDIPSVYHFSGGWFAFDWMIDNWLVYWKYNNPKNRLLLYMKQKFLGLITKDFCEKYAKKITSIDSKNIRITYAVFGSDFLRIQYKQYCKDNFLWDKSAILYDGIVDMKQFQKRAQTLNKDKFLRLLYVGRVAKYKGVHTAVYAVAKLIQMKYNVSLSIAGPLIDKEYGEELHKVVREQNLPVSFLGQVDYNVIQNVYSRHDILIFPSIVEETFGRVPIEAMASDLVVLATGTGGSKEFLKDGENCLLFKPDNPDDLAEKIEVLIKSPDLCDKLRANGMKFVKENFDIEIMGSRIEEYLKTVVNNCPAELDRNL
ncbi:MAG: glycosyltransferase family 4 protein [bacterium]|nr:glycosyltransferase family 4 protein [bacterium]